MSPFTCRVSYFTEQMVRFLVVSACSSSEHVLRLEMGWCAVFYQRQKVSLLATWVDLSEYCLEDCCVVLKYCGATKITQSYFLPKLKTSSKP